MHPVNIPCHSHLRPVPQCGPWGISRRPLAASKATVAGPVAWKQSEKKMRKHEESVLQTQID